jgi:hypothetical protein
MANKSELLHFLDQKVFDPILHAKPHGHNEKDLQFVQQKTEQEKQRFHSYSSAREIVAMYKDDMSSEHARPINARLRELNLPILADVKDEFLKLADDH